MIDRKSLAREIAAGTTPRFIEIKREKGPWRVLGPEEMRNVEKGGYFVSWMTTTLSAFRVGSALPSCRCPTVTPQQGAPIDERYP